MLFADGTPWDRSYFTDALLQQGIDQFSGASGDDIYHVEHTADSIEAADGGNDSVFSTVRYALPENVENLTLEGTANVSATGNALDNRITGNSGDNRLYGGGAGNPAAHPSRRVAERDPNGVLRMAISEKSYILVIVIALGFPQLGIRPEKRKIRPP